MTLSGFLVRYPQDLSGIPLRNDVHKVQVSFKEHFLIPGKLESKIRTKKPHSSCLESPSETEFPLLLPNQMGLKLGLVPLNLC